MFNLETAVQTILQPVNVLAQLPSDIQEAVIDTGDDSIRSMALQALQAADEMLHKLDDNPVAASMAAALKQELQATFEAVRLAPRGQMRGLITRVQSCVRDVSTAYVNCTAVSTRGHAQEHAILEDVLQETQKAAAAVATMTAMTVRAATAPVRIATGLLTGDPKFMPAGATVNLSGTITLPSGAKILREMDIEETADDDARRAAPKDRRQIKAASDARVAARKAGAGYRDRGRAARDQARLQATSRQDEDDRTELLSNRDSAIVIVSNGNLGDRVDGLAEAGGRNAVQFFHEQKVKEYLERLPANLRAAFDLNHDGKVEFWEFDRVRNELVDMSYAQMAALDGDRRVHVDLREGVVSEAHTIREAEFLRAARAMALLRSISQVELNRISVQNVGNRTIDLNGDGEVTRNEIRTIINSLDGMKVAQADFNGNGRLDAAELNAVLLMAEAKDKLRANPVSMSYDRNGIGGVDFREAAAALQAKGITRADQIDTDAEFRAAMGNAPSVPRAAPAAAPAAVRPALRPRQG